MAWEQMDRREKLPTCSAHIISSNVSSGRTKQHRVSGNHPRCRGGPAHLLAPGGRAGRCQVPCAVHPTVGTSSHRSCRRPVLRSCCSISPRQRRAASSNVSANQQVCIFAGGLLPPETQASKLHITLRGDDPLSQEWFLALLCPQFAVLLCGQDRQLDAEDEATRQFDTLWSFKPAVLERVLDQLEQVVAAYRSERLDALQAARQRFPLVAPDPDLVTSFTAELIRYEEELQRRLAATAQQLHHQQRWREDLLATLVHDLRSPLQAVALSLDMLRFPADLSAEDMAMVLGRGASGAKQLQTLIQLTVAPAPQPRQLEIRVRDTGRGIAPDVLPYIFERYHQGQRNDRRGYGLGLYFCRLVAEAHGGQIRLALPAQPPLGRSDL